MGQNLQYKGWNRINAKVERRDDYFVDLLEGERLLHHLLKSVRNNNKYEFIKGVASGAMRFVKDKGLDLNKIRENEKEVILTTDDATVFTFWFGVKAISYKELEKVDLFRYFDFHRTSFEHPKLYSFFLENDVLPVIRSMEAEGLLNQKIVSVWLLEYVREIEAEIRSKIGVKEHVTVVEKQNKTSKRKRSEEWDEYGRLIIKKFNYQQIYDFFKPLVAENEKGQQMFTEKELENWIRNNFSFGKYPEITERFTSNLGPIVWNMLMQKLYTKLKEAGEAVTKKTMREIPLFSLEEFKGRSEKTQKSSFSDKTDHFPGSFWELFED